MYCQSLLQQGGEKFNLALNERDKVLPTVFLTVVYFHFISSRFSFFFFLCVFDAFFGGFVLNLKT